MITCTFTKLSFVFTHKSWNQCASPPNAAARLLGVTVHVFFSLSTKQNIDFNILSEVKGNTRRQTMNKGSKHKRL